MENRSDYSGLSDCDLRTIYGIFVLHMYEVFGNDSNSKEYRDDYGSVLSSTLAELKKRRSMKDEGLK